MMTSNQVNPLILKIMVQDCELECTEKKGKELDADKYFFS